MCWGYQWHQLAIAKIITYPKDKRGIRIVLTTVPEVPRDSHNSSYNCDVIYKHQQHDKFSPSASFSTYLHTYVRNTNRLFIWILNNASLFLAFYAENSTTKMIRVKISTMLFAAWLNVWNTFLIFSDFLDFPKNIDLNKTGKVKWGTFFQACSLSITAGSPNLLVPLWRSWLLELCDTSL